VDTPTTFRSMPRGVAVEPMYARFAYMSAFPIGTPLGPYGAPDGLAL
jgi:hypothetical protein